ncbi:MAG: hypothetical protein JXA41_10360 [Deltaproteobacteria bacterium]|nr:hypothetical protein [Deltaproteobacteria bacterium]
MKEKEAAVNAYQRLKEAYRRQPVMEYKERKAILKAIARILLENDEAICEAVSKDSGNRSFPSILFLIENLAHLFR